MTPSEIRYRARSQSLVLGGGVEIPFRDYDFVVSFDLVSEVSLSALRKALRAASQDSGAGGEISLALAAEPPEQLQRDFHTSTGASLRLVGDELLVVAELFLEGEHEQAEKLPGRLVAYLDRSGAELRDLTSYEQDGGFTSLEALLAMPTRGRTIADAQELADGVVALLTACEGIAREAAIDLVRSRRSDVLVGEPESEWLEVKSAPYRLTEEKEAWELCKDVAAMANASGGLILLGLKSKQKAEIDEIKSVNECRREDLDFRGYRSLIRNHIHPGIEGVVFEFINHSSPDSGVAMISVPAQEEAAKPFLCHGLFIEPGVRGTHFAVPERDGAGTEYLDVRTLHARLRAGGTLLAGEGEIDRLRSQVDEFLAVGIESWLPGVIDAAGDAGLSVEYGRNSVAFSGRGGETVVVDTKSDGPLQSELARQDLLERLEGLGLPLRRTDRGVLLPARQAERQS